MKFKFAPGRARSRPGLEAETFTVDRLWKSDGKTATEISHLIDRTYGYHSPRELAWHLADRFAVPAKAVEIRRV